MVNLRKEGLAETTKCLVVHGRRQGERGPWMLPFARPRSNRRGSRHNFLHILLPGGTLFHVAVEDLSMLSAACFYASQRASSFDGTQQLEVYASDLKRSLFAGDSSWVSSCAQNAGRDSP